MLSAMSPAVDAKALLIFTIREEQAEARAMEADYE